MGYIIRKALFVDPKLHGGAVHGNNRSLGVSRTLVVDGKALQRNVLAVLEIEGQKLRMENEIAVFSANSKVRAVLRSKAIRLIVSSSWLEMHKVRSKAKSG